MMKYAIDREKDNGTKEGMLDLGDLGYEASCRIID